MDYIYDIETYPNCFLLTIENAENETVWQFEISEWCDDQLMIRLIVAYFVAYADELNPRMIGFNNTGFDYPVLHYLLSHDEVTPRMLYDKATTIINAENKFEHIIPHTRHIIPQIDLFKIHHFDNRARSTSLKMMEFNMRSYNIRDLPFPPGTLLKKTDREILKKYNRHDVTETLKFYNLSKPLINFRSTLSTRYSHNFLNHNDTRIGKDYMVMRLEDRAPGCCYDPHNRRPKQTKRHVIHLNECIIPYINFERHEFQTIKQWFQAQHITETAKVFKNLHCYVDGFKFTFGTGGLHGSVDFREYKADDQFEIIDLDVKAYYASLAIAQKFYPRHLGNLFCTIYKSILDERGKFKPGTLENMIYKLALNGVFGNSNNRYSPFYDPQFTLSITLNGQLLMCVLAEKLMAIKEIEMIQVNTDGLTFRSPRTHHDQITQITQAWEHLTQLTLEQSNYSKLYIRDVNNYLAVYDNNRIKRKGAYEYEREWHQNHSALVIPKAVEAYLLQDIPISDFIKNHQDIYDFMLRAKANRNMQLILDKTGINTPLDNIVRYYVTNSDQGGTLKKIMPPLAGSTDERIREIESNWRVIVCNDMSKATSPIDYNYYIEKAEALALPFH